MIFIKIRYPINPRILRRLEDWRIELDEDMCPKDSAAYFDELQLMDRVWITHKHRADTLLYWLTSTPGFEERFIRVTEVKRR